MVEERNLGALIPIAIAQSVKLVIMRPQSGKKTASKRKRYCHTMSFLYWVLRTLMYSFSERHAMMSLVPWMIYKHLMKLQLL